MYVFGIQRLNSFHIYIYITFANLTRRPMRRDAPCNYARLRNRRVHRPSLLSKITGTRDDTALLSSRFSTVNHREVNRARYDRGRNEITIVSAALVTRILEYQRTFKPRHRALGMKSKRAKNQPPLSRGVQRRDVSDDKGTLEFMKHSRPRECRLPFAYRRRINSADIKYRLVRFRRARVLKGAQVGPISPMPILR